MLDQPVDEPAAFLKLGDGDPLVGLVRLIDVARPAYDRRDSGLREQAALGAIGDLAVVVSAGQPFREQRHIGVYRRIEAGELAAILKLEARLRRDLLHL